MKHIFLLLLLAGMISPASANDGYVLKVTLTGNYSGYVYLFYNNVKDSALVHNNTFEFTGKLDKPVHAWIHLKPPSNVEWIYLENSTISVQAEHKTSIQQNELINWMVFNEITGSYSQKIYAAYRDFYQSNKSREDFDQVLFQELKRMCRENPKHPVIGTLLSSHATQPKITYDNFAELCTMIDTASMHRYDVKQLYIGMCAMKNYGIDKPFYPFSLPGLTGTTISLKNYTGKFILIDFWASWCGPCRKKHPAMKDLETKYKGKNFAIVGISIDKDEADWRKAVEKDDIRWDNALDQDQKTQLELGIQMIPTQYLLDPSGKILATGFSLEEIDKMLSELLN